MPRRWNGNRRRADRKADRMRTIKLRVLGEKKAAAAVGRQRPMPATYSHEEQATAPTAEEVSRTPRSAA